MLINKTIIRVRYADTDKMEFVYNGKYLEYFEVGRTEMLRNAGLPYTQLEEAGYQLPLIEANLKYKQPAKYDDLLEIEARLKKIETAKIHIDYKIKRKGTDELIAEGFTEHAFIHVDSKKPTRPPQIFIDTLERFFVLD